MTRPPFTVAWRPAGAGGRCWHVVATFEPYTGKAIARTTSRAEADRMARNLNASSFDLAARASR